MVVLNRLNESNVEDVVFDRKAIKKSEKKSARIEVYSLVEKIREKREVRNALLEYFKMNFRPSKYSGQDFNFLRRKYAKLIKDIYKKNIVSYYIELKAMIDSNQVDHPLVNFDLYEEVELLEKIFKKAYNYSPS